MSGPLYWDSSAVLSALLQDKYSKDAAAHSHSGGLHLLSSLTWAETHAVLARIERERVLTQVLVRAAREALDTGPWRRVTIWLRHKHHGRNWRWLRHRYLPGWWPTAETVGLYNPGAVKIYRP